MPYKPMLIRKKKYKDASLMGIAPEVRQEIFRYLSPRFIDVACQMIPRTDQFNLRTRCSQRHCFAVISACKKLAEEAVVPMYSNTIFVLHNNLAARALFDRVGPLILSCVTEISIIEYQESPKSSALSTLFPGAKSLQRIHLGNYCMFTPSEKSVNSFVRAMHLAQWEHAKDKSADELMKLFTSSQCSNCIKYGADTTVPSVVGLLAGDDSTKFFNNIFGKLTVCSCGSRSPKSERFHYELKKAFEVVVAERKSRKRKIEEVEE
ncbi:hypothetical protein KVT40_008279 [Elsinoe batatas]|uniref:Uncharacterized protein n=1 Tax=Elsinoe batatas TaxID=2601811 RepID=A0A8K0KZY8_9PEZI|nr:hypothetical protein KVT40_008279 [Elsinoe batatas]